MLHPLDTRPLLASCGGAAGPLLLWRPLSHILRSPLHELCCLFFVCFFFDFVFVVLVCLKVFSCFGCFGCLVVFVSLLVVCWLFVGWCCLFVGWLVVGCWL